MLRLQNHRQNPGERETDDMIVTLVNEMMHQARASLGGVHVTPAIAEVQERHGAANTDAVGAAISILVAAQSAAKAFLIERGFREETAERTVRQIMARPAIRDMEKVE